MDKVKDYFRKIYGMDALSCGCILLSLMINLAAMLSARAGHPWKEGWTFIVFIPLFICLLRYFSTNRLRRRAENEWFVRRLEKLFTRKPKAEYGQNYRMEGKVEDKQAYKFFKCPSCRQRIRIPKGKGRIEITCPRCGERFIKKS